MAAAAAAPPIDHKSWNLDGPAPSSNSVTNPGFINSGEAAKPGFINRPWNAELDRRPDHCFAQPPKQ